MRVIGLTGNIATGKSTVARMLADRGACVIDADRLAHVAMRPGKPIHQRIVERFGPAVCTDTGEIDRSALGAIVFKDADALADLEAIVHPWVVRETRRRLADCAAPVAVVEAIKLLEAEMHADCDVVWVVTAPRDQQLARLVDERGLSRQEAERRVDAQSPQEAKAARADLVIDNSGTLNELQSQVHAGWTRLLDEQGGREEATAR